MSEKIDLQNLDRRLAERLIRAGKLSQSEWDKHLQTLPDSADQGAAIEAELETGIIERD
ncbi:hypothetical protein [Vulgatibacter incomptus]|uniref:Uncharacterized protein n=1 Tax=Vulgatibacter incomptus TaxID=1391653 RepID=A0A0K1PFP6_9BACT|nr:hypothetical protein [Vulgatibacter incomptus]AKU91939.1 hypothetical protein AKJ08_2326 [Vulgatibacter incomptus]